MYNEEIGDRLKKEIIRLIEGHEGHVVSIETVCDHVHILAELSPKYAVANEIATLKTVTARILRRDYGDYLKQFLWGDSFWSRSYFIATSGGVTLDILKEYVENAEQETWPSTWNKKEKIDYFFIIFFIFANSSPPESKIQMESSLLIMIKSKIQRREKKNGNNRQKRRAEDVGYLYGGPK